MSPQHELELKYSQTKLTIELLVEHMIAPVNFDPKVLFSAQLNKARRGTKITSRDLVKLLTWCKDLYETKIQTNKIFKLVCQIEQQV